MAKLYFYYAAMNAGKSTMLLQAAYNYKERGMDTLLLKPSIDNRWGPSTIKSRIGIEAEAISIPEDFNIFFALKDTAGAYLTKCVMIDESQFLTKKQVIQVSKVADILDIPVLCYGLRSDFRGDGFPGSMGLMAIADEIHEIKTICKCGKKAIMNMRIDTEGKRVLSGDQIEIGGNERYLSVCRNCYMFAD